MLLQADDALDQRQRGERQQADADPVEALARSFAQQWQQVERRQSGERAERQVDQENRLPAEQVEQRTAERRGDRRRQYDGKAQHARSFALARNQEQAHDHQHTHRLQDSGGGALNDAYRDDKGSSATGCRRRW